MTLVSELLEYKRIFESAPALLLLLDKNPEFTILDASDAYLRATRKQRQAIVGRPIFDVFPDNPDEEGTRPGTILRASLERVIASRSAETMAMQRYDIRRPAGEGGGFEERYWSPVNSPVLSDRGEILYIVLCVEDVTDLVLANGAAPQRNGESRRLEVVRSRELDEANRQLRQANEQFRAIYEQGLFAGRLDLEGRVVDANRASVEGCGFTRESVIGKPFWECGWWNRSPEMQEWVRKAVEQAVAGEPFRGESRYFWADGTEHVVDFACMPIRDAIGRVAVVIPTGMDITERVQGERIRRAYEEERRRAETLASLRASEERFRSALLNSPLPTLLFDDQEQILAVSRSFLEEAGYSREELRRMEDWTDRAYRERSREVLEQIRQMISIEPEALRVDLTVRTKEGRERLWNFVSSPLGTQSDGRRLFVCMAQDVTERKAHEEQIRLLMREANHRVKNLLTLVQAIARQTAGLESKDFIGRFTERVQALAANQDLLVRNDWQGVDVEDLVRAQLAHFGDLIGSRIAVHGPKLHLTAVSAQAIGLALHELATNAGKYGALSTDAGRVDVRWRLDGDIFAISWIERNGPPVRRPERRGFGSTVTDTMAKRTLGGEVQLDYAPSGLEWRVSCPAANTLERTMEAIDHSQRQTTT